MMILCKYRLFFFLFKQKTAYDVRISDWSSDVFSSDLSAPGDRVDRKPLARRTLRDRHRARRDAILQPRGDDHGRRAIGRHDGRTARGVVRRGLTPRPG